MVKLPDVLAQYFSKSSRPILSFSEMTQLAGFLFRVFPCDLLTFHGAALFRPPYISNPEAARPPCVASRLALGVPVPSIADTVSFLHAAFFKGHTDPLWLLPIHFTFTREIIEWNRKLKRIWNVNWAL